MKYNHLFDVAFGVISDKEDPYDVTTEELIEALEKRLTALKTTDRSDAYAAAVFGYCDATYEEED